MKKEEIQDLRTLHHQLVLPVCALEDYVLFDSDTSPLLEVCIKQMRTALNEFGQYIIDCVGDENGIR